MTEKKYNGWTNYETWCVGLWLGNEEGTQRYWEDKAKEVYNESKEEHNWSKKENATFKLANELKEDHEEFKPDLGCTVWADLLNASLSEVNWHEIAKHYLEDME